MLKNQGYKKGHLQPV